MHRNTRNNRSTSYWGDGIGVLMITATDNYASLVGVVRIGRKEVLREAGSVTKGQSAEESGV